MNKKEIKKKQKKIEEEADYIYCPRLSNSLEKFTNTYPDGVDNERICKVLLLEEEELEDIFNSAINKLRKALKIEGN